MNSYALNYDDEVEPVTRLKTAIDIAELGSSNSQGVEFEVENENEGQEEETDIHTFNKTEVVSNICLISDDEEEDDDGEYLTEVEKLWKRFSRTIDSDITPAQDGGVLKQMKNPGTGDIIPYEALVTVHYNAYTEVGQPPYDSTRLRREPTKIRLTDGKIVKGFELALLSMRKNELSRFLIRQDYAYGQMGCPPRIPQNANIIMDIEVIHFVAQDGVEDYYEMTPEERRSKLVYNDIEKVVKAENAEAKQYFDGKNYHKAFGKYRHAINILESYHLKNESEEVQWKKQLQKVNLNAAMCCYNLKHFRRAITYCNLVLKNDQDCIKAHYFKGKALHGLGSFEDAITSLKAARNIDPSNAAVSSALKSVAKSIKEYQHFEKSMYQRMFSEANTDSKTSEEPKKELEVLGENVYGPCSDAFKNLVQEQLKKFQDSNMTEMPFPSIHMTESEIKCILTTAVTLGMDVKQRGTGSSVHYEVYKKSVKLE
ncbi:unnamed protein product [Lymnaea stagnalis]|uniref:peptidylprolyl isomerase n=1 Tax=Lymnaea stagnalis TaxID=6523 RepID=A0AAV2HCP2_LYMST